MGRLRNPWLAVGLDAFALGLEASTVIGLRTMKLAAGGAKGEAEARRMVAEKVDAAVALQHLAMTGALGFSAPSAAAKTIKHYRRRVRANRRRLAKG
jgi:ABC-type sugar transport system substrate-binding protein